MFQKLSWNIYIITITLKLMIWSYIINFFVEFNI